MLSAEGRLVSSDSPLTLFYRYNRFLSGSLEGGVWWECILKPRFLYVLQDSLQKAIRQPYLKKNGFENRDTKSTD